jgi:hypothetical protein
MNLVINVPCVKVEAKAPTAYETRGNVETAKVEIEAKAPTVT